MLTDSPYENHIIPHFEDCSTDQKKPNRERLTVNVFCFCSASVPVG